MNKPLHYFERTGLFMHNGNTHGCESWKLIGECTDEQFHEFVDRLTAWRKKNKIEVLPTERVKEFFSKFMRER